MDYVDTIKKVHETVKSLKRNVSTARIMLICHFLFEMARKTQSHIVSYQIQPFFTQLIETLSLMQILAPTLGVCNGRKLSGKLSHFF